MHETCIIPLGDEIRNIRLVVSQSDRRITLGCVINKYLVSGHVHFNPQCIVVNNMRAHLIHEYLAEKNINEYIGENMTFN